MAIELREARESDLAEAAALIARVFERAAPPDGAERLQWQLFANPARPPHIPAGWIIRDDGAAVGFLANIPRRMRFNGRDRLVACTAKYVTLPTHRLHGLALAKTYFSQPGVDALFISSASDTSAPILKKFGAKEIEGVDRGAVFAVRPARVAGEILRQKPRTRAIAAVAAPLAGLALRAGAVLRAKPKIAADVRVESLGRFSAETDVLWSATSDDFSACAERSSEVLNWQFVNGPRSRPATKILACKRGAALTGFAVLQDRENAQFAIRRRHVMDIFTRRGDDAAFDALVAAALHETRRDGPDTLEFRHLSSARLERLASWGARLRTLPLNPFLIKPVQPDLTLPASADGWYLTPGDGDGAGW